MIPAFLPESIEHTIVWQVFWLVPVSRSLPIPILRNSGRFFSNHDRGIATGHHSSGYCHGFLPYSLFIAVISIHCNTI